MIKIIIKTRKLLSLHDHYTINCALNKKKKLEFFVVCTLLFIYSVFFLCDRRYLKTELKYDPPTKIDDIRFLKGLFDPSVFLRKNVAGNCRFSYECPGLSIKGTSNTPRLGHLLFVVSLF